MKAFLRFLMRFPRMGLEWVQNSLRYDLRIDPESTSRYDLQTGLQMPSDLHIQTSDIPKGQNRPY